MPRYEVAGRVIEEYRIVVVGNDVAEARDAFSRDVFFPGCYADSDEVEIYEVCELEPDCS